MAVNDKDVLDKERDIWKQYIIGQAKDTNDTMEVVIILRRGCSISHRYSLYDSHCFHRLLSLSSGFSPSLPSLCNTTVFKGRSTRFCFVSLCQLSQRRHVGVHINILSEYQNNLDDLFLPCPIACPI